jgi:uncharacterized protein
VIAVDTNLLVYAHRRDAPFHEPAAAVVRETAESGGPWAIPWPCVHEFVAIVTHPRIFDPPSTVAEAFDQLDAWAEAPSLRFLGEAVDHLARLRAVAGPAGTVGARIHDARVAAICLAHGVSELWTVDRDFSRFPSLPTRNPLVES